MFNKLPENCSFLKLCNRCNCCFINSITQCLLNLDEVQIFLLKFGNCVINHKFEDIFASSPLWNISKIYMKFAESQKPYVVLDNSLYLKSIYENYDEFFPNEQSDAHEFFLCTFSSFDETIQQLNELLGKVEIASFASLFEATVINFIQCECGKSISSTDKYLTIPLHASYTSMEDAIENFLYIDQKVASELSCHKNLKSTSCRQFASLPKILTFVFNRFQVQSNSKRFFSRNDKNSTYVKNANCISLLKKLNLRGEKEIKYHLKSVVFHLGKSIQKGHYVAVYRSNKHWILADDDSARTLGSSETKEFIQFGHIRTFYSSPAAYMLFYEDKNS